MAKIILSTIALFILWLVITVTGHLYGWWHPVVAEPGNNKAFQTAAKEIIHSEYVGNVAMSIIEDGLVTDRFYYSASKPVDENTLFQVASLSKWVSAWGVMKLVEEGKLQLDAPVSQYLTRYQLPESEFDNNGVITRRLISHTAGLTDGLGYAGFEHDSLVQTPEASLSFAKDASPGANPVVKVAHEPGTKWQYSGGGYTLLQLLIEEVSSQSFNDYMLHEILQPLGMTSSTYILPDSLRSNLSKSYGTDSVPTEYLYFSSMAATSLYTTLSDMEKFMLAHLPGKNGEPVGRNVLQPETVDMMKEPHAHEMGAAIWGLGPMLFAPDNNGGFIFGHDGKNEPAINTAARLDTKQGDGIIIFETGSPLLATTLGSEWTYWKTGNIDFLMFTSQMEAMVSMVFMGWGAILLTAVIFFLRWRKLRLKLLAR